MVRQEKFDCTCNLKTALKNVEEVLVFPAKQWLTQFFPIGKKEKITCFPKKTQNLLAQALPSKAYIQIRSFIDKTFQNNCQYKLCYVQRRSVAFGFPVEKQNMLPHF